MTINMQWYGRRYGRKLSVRRLELLKTLLPKVGFNFETLQTNIEPLIDRLIGKHEVWLEIGFGTGEHLMSLAHLISPSSWLRTLVDRNVP